MFRTVPYHDSALFDSYKNIFLRQMNPIREDDLNSLIYMHPFKKDPTRY